MKNIIVLGATGSIGTQTLEVLKTRKDYNLVGVSCDKNIDLIESFLNIFKKIKYVAIKDKRCGDAFKKKHKNLIVYVGENANIELIKNHEADVYLNSISGFAGFLPSVEIIKKDKVLLLANKESLVAGGELINELLINHLKAKLIPVDSEHVAISKCLSYGNKNDIKKLVITASGGKFFEYSLNDLNSVKYDDVLSHPNWNMGKKITVDSNTMINKTFELIEAYYLFNIPFKKISAVVNRESFVHGYVKFKNKVIAQVAKPTMIDPIIYALNFDKEEKEFPDCEINNLKNYKFYKLSKKRFSCLKYSSFVIKHKGDSGCVLNAADEIAVNAFINKKIEFKQITNVIDFVMKNFKFSKKHDINHLINIDKKVREYTSEVINKYV